jgi:hypothetical protein
MKLTLTRSALCIGALACITLGTFVPSWAAAASVAPRPHTAQPAPVTCNPMSSHRAGSTSGDARGNAFVRCAIRINPRYPRLGGPRASTAPANAKFDFCNTTGGIIACFNAMLHYDSATEFTLYDIELSDDLCDSRAVFADVDSQAVDFGYLEDSNGCGTTVFDDTSPINLSDPFFGVQYVYIDLYACNFFSCSSDAYSNQASNPLDGGPLASRSAGASRPGHQSTDPITVRPLKVPWHLSVITAAERNQVGLDAKATALTSLVKRDHLAGYAGLAVSPARDFLTLYWKGRVPGALRRYAAGKHAGGAVRFASARYSLAQLDSVRNRIVGSPGFPHSGITMVAPANDGSGLQIGFSSGQAKARSLAADKAGGIRVTFTRQPQSVPLAGRWADVQPFFGGGLINSALNSEDCTAGWPIHATLRPATFYIITAAHCTYRPSVNPATNVWTTGRWTAFATKHIGTVVPRHALGLDAGLINTGMNGSVGGGGGRTIYTGGVDPKGNGLLEKAAGIDGSTKNFVGNTVCTSGAYSGEICGLKIENTNATWRVLYSDGTVVVVHGLLIKNPKGTNAAGQGDSGGPVYSYANAGLVAARGIISTGVGGTTTQCTGVLHLGNNPHLKERTCYSQIYVPDINAILSSPFFPKIALNLQP